MIEKPLIERKNEADFRIEKTSEKYKKPITL